MNQMNLLKSYWAQKLAERNKANLIQPGTLSGTRAKHTYNTLQESLLILLVFLAYLKIPQMFNT